MFKEVNYYIVICSLLLCIYLISSCQHVPVAINDKIPDGYRTYTTFLWSTFADSVYTRNQWKEMERAFIRLGQSIGPENATIWLYNESKTEVSIERSQNIIDMINRDKMFIVNIANKLKYDETPIILFTTYNPEKAAYRASHYYSAISFKKSDPKLIIDFFNALAQLIRDKKIYRGTLEGIEVVKNVKNSIRAVEIELGIGPLKVTKPRE
jgi:predicted methyltransferase